MRPIKPLAEMGLRKGTGGDTLRAFQAAAESLNDCDILPVILVAVRTDADGRPEVFLPQLPPENFDLSNTVVLLRRAADEVEQRARQQKARKGRVN